MFRYTKASIYFLINDFKKITRICKYLSLAFTIGFLSYQIAAGKGYLIINIVLMCLFVVFTTIDIILDFKKQKLVKKIFSRIYKWLKIIIKCVTLVMSLIEISKTPTGNIDPISIILATLMIVLWVISFLSEIFLEVVSDRCEELLVAFNEDVEDIKKPITNIKKFFGKTNDETPLDKRKEKIIAHLNERIKKDSDDRERTNSSSDN